MKIVTEQALIFSKVMDNGQLRIVEPGGKYTTVYYLAPKQSEVPIDKLVADKKYNFVLTVYVTLKAEKASVGNETKWLNKVDVFIEDIKELVEDAE